jgi:hypothetical protein
METNKVLELLKNYKSSSNKELTDLLEFLHNDFYKTKDLIIKLTNHLDITESSYNKVFEEYKKRIPNE